MQRVARRRRRIRGGFIEFAEFEGHVERFLSQYQGRLLNAVPPFDVIMPTLENIAEVFNLHIAELLASNGFVLTGFEISENPTRTYVITKTDAVQEDQGHRPGNGQAEHGFTGDDGWLTCRTAEGAGASGDPVTHSPGDAEGPAAYPAQWGEPCPVDWGKGIGHRLDGRVFQNRPGDAPSVKRDRLRTRGDLIYLYTSLVILLAAAVSLIFVITRNGIYPWGSDTWGHLFKSDLLYKSITSGIYFPQYTPSWYNGIQPFRYWAPFPYYIIAIIQLITGGDMALSYNIFIFIRFYENKEAFYFGLSIFALSIFGVLFADNRSRIGFGMALLVFLGTTKSLISLIAKMPMSQLFWMRRFTPLAMGLFFMSILNWRNIRRGVLVAALLLVMADGLATFKTLGYGVEFPRLKADLDLAASIATQRIAMVDNSEFGSFPSYYISNNPKGKDLGQVFGWAWQGAETSRNIMWLNTALENGFYDYMFDRYIELGADTLVVKKDLIKNRDEFLARGHSLGYGMKYETDDTYILKLPVEHSFATKVDYKHLGIGSYADNLALIFPKLETGGSIYLDDYTEEKLQGYELVYLSGFRYRDKTRAEGLVTRLSEKGVQFVIDLTGAQDNPYTSRASFLEVAAQPVKFTGRYPNMQYAGDSYSLSEFPGEYTDWRTLYLENLDHVWGSAQFDYQLLGFVGTKINDDITFVGFNLPFFALETGDENAIAILEHITGLNAFETPDRQFVNIDISTEGVMIDITADEEGALTDVAALDAFKAEKGEFRRVHNLVLMKGKHLRLKVFCPYSAQGIMVSLAGVIGLGTVFLFPLKKERRIGLDGLSIQK